MLKRLRTDVDSDNKLHEKEQSQDSVWFSVESVKIWLGFEVAHLEKWFVSDNFVDLGRKMWF